MKIRNVLSAAAFVIFISGCSVIDTFEARGLKKYFLGFLKANNIVTKDVVCKMSPPSSRTGYYLFVITPQEFSRLREALHLKEMAVYDASVQGRTLNPEIFFMIKRISLVSEFHFKNPRYDQNDINTWGEYPFLPDVKVYRADPPLSPLAGNTRSSFDFLLYNSSTGKCCAFLQYPYG